MPSALQHFLLAALLAATSWPAWAAGIAYDINHETSPFMQSSSYNNLQKLTSKVGPSGAFGTLNQAWDTGAGHEWYIEEQRYGAELVAGGIARHNTGAIDKGLLALRWGFRQQKQDGGFSCPDAFHSTALFLEAAAHTALLLKDSEYADRYGDVFKEFKTKLRTTANWMMQTDIETQGRHEDAPYTHRYYLVAAALGETGIFLNDQEMIKHSQDYVRQALAMQDSSGYNPERAGWDSSYHATGMLYACRYYTIAADSQMRPQLYKMLDKAARWEASRVDVSGTVTADDNTSIGAGTLEKNRDGSVQKISANHVYQSLYYWSLISGDTSYESLAQRIAQAAHQWH